MVDITVETVCLDFLYIGSLYMFICMSVLYLPLASTLQMWAYCLELRHRSPTPCLSETVSGCGGTAWLWQTRWTPPCRSMRNRDTLLSCVLLMVRDILPILLLPNSQNKMHKSLAWYMQLWCHNYVNSLDRDERPSYKVTYGSKLFDSWYIFLPKVELIWVAFNYEAEVILYMCKFS